MVSEVPIDRQKLSSRMKSEKLAFNKEDLMIAEDLPPPGIEPGPQVPETCVISISPRGQGWQTITLGISEQYGLTR